MGCWDEGAGTKTENLLTARRRTRSLLQDYNLQENSPGPLVLVDHVYGSVICCCGRYVLSVAIMMFL